MKAFTKEARKLACASLALAFLLAAIPVFAGDGRAVPASLKTITAIASTVPGNGDVNPYGMAEVKHTTGNLCAGQTINADNLPGSCPGGVGLTTALVVLERCSGWYSIRRTACTSWTTAAARSICCIERVQLRRDAHQVPSELTGVPAEAARP